MKNDLKLEKTDKIVDAAHLLMLSEAATARDQCKFPVKHIDPDGLKLEAFAVGFLFTMCHACELPRDTGALRLVSYLLFLRERWREDPLVAAERAFIYELHHEFGPYFDQGVQRAERILAGDHSVGLYAQALKADPVCQQKSYLCRSDTK